jgi:myo-inositol-1(or 4)-monophosphatase
MATAELTPEDFTHLLSFTKQLAKSAGEVIRSGSVAIFRQFGQVDEKLNSVDLVTEWDVKVEDLVRGEISKSYPSFKLSVSLSLLRQ